MAESIIYKAISNVMSEIGAVEKNQKNIQQNFMFRGIDAVMNAINPALIKYKVFVVPEILEQIREERQTKNGSNLIYSVCKVKYTFFAEDGSNIQAVVIGEGMDSGDKATNKAMSIAFKYACFQVFCIPTEEMKDPDGDSHDLKPKEKQKTQKPNYLNEYDFDIFEFLKVNGLEISFVEKTYGKKINDLSEKQINHIRENVDKLITMQKENKDK